jgi:hypothetical protein
MPTPRSILAAFGVAALVAFGAACGDDDSGSTAESADAGTEADDGGAEVAAYCTMIGEFETAEEFPSDEQLDELASIAPEEIRDDVAALVEGLKADEEPSDEETTSLQEAEERVTAWEDENCAAEETEETTGSESATEE